MDEKKEHENFFKHYGKNFYNYIKKRIKVPGLESLSASLIAIFFGLIIGFVILIISNPSASFRGLGKILAGGFTGGSRGVGDVFYYATPILLTGLSVGFAFKTGLFNIGASGQYVFGQFFTVLVAVSLGTRGVAPGLTWPLALLAGFIGGSLIGFFPGLLKAYANANEVITSIMFNYIGMYLVNMLVMSTPFIYNRLKTRTVDIPASASLPKMGLDHLFPGSSINGGIIIAIFTAIIIYIIINKTTLGYQLKACGFNRHASKYAGINEKRSIILAMTIAGGLAGLGGALVILSGTGNHIETVDVLAPNGFNGIPVALLALSNPIGIIFSALFISHLQRGGFYMQLHAFPLEVIDIILAVIIYFSAFAFLIKRIIEKIKSKRRKELLNEEGDVT